MKKIKNTIKYKYIFFLLMVLIIIFLKEGIYLKIKDNNFVNFLPNINFELNNNMNKNLTLIFNSRRLFINDINITSEYIHYIRPIKETKKTKNNLENNFKIKISSFLDRENQSINFFKLCAKEQLIDSKKYYLSQKPLISIILPSYNKENVIMKSIRSIQNQSFKNIEIIIVDDHSTDNSKKIYNYLLESEPRVRIFFHLKNMGVWRTRIDGLLYSKGKYIIYFDTGDLYADNYVLEDAFSLIEKYQLDSIRMLFKCFNNYTKIENSKKAPFPKNVEYNKIVYKKENVIKYNKEIFKSWGTLWTRLTKADILIKGLSLLSSRILNIYKNFWEDLWWNRIIDEVSYNLLIIKRYAYFYFINGKGEGTIKKTSKYEKDKMIHEFLYFLYFDLEFLPKNDNKKIIINKLRKYNNKKSVINLNNFLSKFYILDNIILILLKDPFVSINDKVFLRQLLNDSRKRQKNIY